MKKTTLWLPGGGGRIDWGVRTDICTLLFIKQIIRTYRVAQGTQYSVMSFMGKESKKSGYVYN